MCDCMFDFRWKYIIVYCVFCFNFNLFFFINCWDCKVIVYVRFDFVVDNFISIMLLWSVLGDNLKILYIGSFI